MSDLLSDAWEARAHDWAAWARTPGHDVYFWELNWPAFGELLPPAGRATLDIGCGEGRIGRELARAGHRMHGLDSSPTLSTLAREAGGYVEVVCGDASVLPWPDRTFDLAIAFMSMHDMDDVVPALNEAARVLVPGGRLCCAIVHPLNRAPEAWGDYFREQRTAVPVERDGLRMVFESIERPLGVYTRGLASAGFVIEQLREPRAEPTAEVQRSPLAPAARKPYFLHMRCRLDG